MLREKTPPNKKLLKPLITALRRLDRRDWKKAGFNMSHWAVIKKPKTTSLGCGTACCAYGLGTALPSWKKAGVTLIPVSKNHENMWKPNPEAVEILGLIGHWDYVFAPTCYLDLNEDISPGKVANRIEIVIAAEERRKKL